MTAEQEYYAKEAARLLADDTLAEALSRIQKKAVAELLADDLSDTHRAIRMQTMANMTTEILDELQSMTLAMASDGGFDPNKPTA